MEIVSAIIGPVVESLMVPIKRHLGYIISSTDNVRNMNDLMKQLDGKMADVTTHKETNDRNTLEVPARIPSWLEDIEAIKLQAQSISSNANGCLNLKARYQVGRKAWKTTQVIERLHKEEFDWTDTQKPLGRVNTKGASTFTASHRDIRGGFRSRDKTFKDALKFLQQDNKTQVIALSGMGGVGKTTMMEELKKVVEDNRMFDWVVKVSMGKQPKKSLIQQAVAESLSHSLTEEVEEKRAERLGKIFEGVLKDSKKGILVILDDVWENAELKDIGLNPLPNGIKILLTSRFKEFCERFAVQDDILDLEVLKLDVLEEAEAQEFFCQITGVSKEHQPELYQIGGKIVKKCSCLPLAIKLIAPNLKSKGESEWRDTLHSLKDNANVQEIISTSYNYLDNKEYKEIFLLCGLFPEDFDIPIEDLTRYAWGLKLLNRVSTFRAARDRVEACVSSLKDANLLIDVDYLGYVKMHDLVLDFVLATLSNGDHASIIKHGDIPEWSGDEMNESCKMISLSGIGICEFIEGFKCPSLSLLKLRDDDYLPKIPKRFYGNMKELEVIAYQHMYYASVPLVLRSFQCSINLRTLCLSTCSLDFDYSSIGNLLKLEVLSLSQCWIRSLPSSIGNLKKLRVLDLTGCARFHIDDGVLQNLVNLEEIYMKNNGFTERNSNELRGRSKNLSTLEIACHENEGQLNNMSYENLDRFKIYVGTSFDSLDKKMKLSRNTLYLVINKDEFLESSMNVLLHKTELLFLQMDGMSNLEDIEGKSLHLPQYSSFRNLRVLKLLRCVDLRYAFTVRVAMALPMLEHLDIFSCHSMEEVIQSSGSQTIRFPKLKFLSLKELPKLLSFCTSVNVIELPQLMYLQLDELPNFTSIFPKKTLSSSAMEINDTARRSFLNEEDAVPKLEKLVITNMANLEEIWPCQYSSSEEVDVCILREIDVQGCDRLVNLFPSNPMRLLHHLEDVIVANCGSLEMLFNIDLRCVGEGEEIICCLRSIRVWSLRKLREVWRIIKGANDPRVLIHGFDHEAIESLNILDCVSFRNVFGCEESDQRNIELVEGNQQQEFSQDDVSWSIGLYHKDIQISMCCALSSVIPFKASRQMQKLEKLFLLNCASLLEIFETQGINNNGGCRIGFNEGSRVLDTTPTIPRPNNFNVPWSSNLHILKISECNLLQHVFTFSMIESLRQLNELEVVNCKAMEVIVKDETEEQTCKHVEFPCLKSIMLLDLPRLKGFFLGTNKSKWPLLDDLTIVRCPQMTVFTIGCSIAPNLNNLHGKFGKYSIECGHNIHQTTCSSLDGTCLHLTTSKGLDWSFCYLIEVRVSLIHDGETVIPYDELLQVKRLEKIFIDYCDSIKVVFGALEGNDSEFNDIQVVVEIPKLREVKLVSLHGLKYLWKSNPRMVMMFPSLTKVSIDGCQSIEHVLTTFMVGSLLQLQELHIVDCKSLEVVVKEENMVLEKNKEHDVKVYEILLPHLKSLKLRHLPSLKGFCLGNEAFSWPSLKNLEIAYCPGLTVFTNGHLTTPKLKVIDTSFGRFEVSEDLNSVIKIIKEEPHRFEVHTNEDEDEDEDGPIMP